MWNTIFSKHIKIKDSETIIPDDINFRYSNTIGGMLMLLKKKKKDNTILKVV